MWPYDLYVHTRKYILEHKMVLENGVWFGKENPKDPCLCTSCRMDYESPRHLLHVDGEIPL